MSPRSKAAPIAAEDKPDTQPESKPVAVPSITPDSIFLMDAMSFIFRAYHAMARQRSMSTKTGLPTAATYVFVNMLRKLREDFSPAYLAAVFDVAAPTFRDKQAESITAVRKFDAKTQTFQEIEYKGYKANRAEMPGDLAQQLPYIRRALDAYRIPILEYPGYEADDVIGTLAKQAAEQARCVYVVSSDKDMMQLVNDHVLILNPPKDNLICDARKVEEILGVPPERVVDVMALRGDSIDNIPGAPGVGDKGSVELIKRFGNVEAALDHAAEIERKTYRESLQNNRDVVMLSKQLATIDCNVPVKLDVESMKTGEADTPALRELFAELEFTSLLKNLTPETDVKETHYSEIKSVEEMEKFLRSITTGSIVSVAIEVNAMESEEPEVEENEATLPLIPQEIEMKFPGMAISIAPGEARTILPDGKLYERFASTLRGKKSTLAVHDYKTALHALKPGKIELGDIAHDPMLYSYLLDPTYTSHRLPDVAFRRLNQKLNGSVSEAADITGRLASSLRQEVEEAGLLKLYEEIDRPLLPVLSRMEQAGVKIDRTALREMSSRLEQAIDAKGKEIYASAGCEFNVNSPKQLGDVLFNRLNLPKPVKYGKGKTISTAVDVLEELAEAHAVPQMVLEYRQLSKLKSTYVDALPLLINASSGRLHTTFLQAATATGRLSSVNPNLQNIPIRTELGREIRAAFTVEPGNVLMAADYSQIELRLLAHYSKDRLLVEAFRNGDDVHTLTASQVFNVPPLMVTADHRRQAKVVNFGIVYGLSAFGLSQNLKIEPSEAKQFIQAYFEKYSGVRSFIDRTLEEVRRDQSVKNLFGRVRPIPDVNSKNANLRGFAERTAVNTPLQGTAADLIKIAMIRIDATIRERNLKSRMTLQVHDELVFEVPENEIDIMRSLVKEQMENVHPLYVPLLVEIGVGPNWRDLD